MTSSRRKDFQRTEWPIQLENIKRPNDEPTEKQRYQDTRMGEPPGKKARTSDRVKSPMIEQTIKMNGKVKKGQQPTQNRKRVNPEEQTETYLAPKTQQTGARIDT